MKPFGPAAIDLIRGRHMHVSRVALLAAMVAAHGQAFAQSAPAQPPVEEPQVAAADAQPPAASPAQEDSATEVVVTGTRVARDGYQAPTPLTVVGAEQLRAAARENIADAVNTLPSVSSSVTPKNSQGSIGTGTAGINAINLRGLGANRTLILFDGQRSVASSASGLVDVNDFPQALISRVEVVTGGASAAYGSDALSGVVNFILDRRFTGIRASASSGITTYGDDRTWDASIAGGLSFADNRGHLIISGEMSGVQGTDGDGGRRWDREGWEIINNPAYTPTNGQPERLLLPQVALANATAGGIITNTALRGTAFGAGGVPYQFNYGPILSGGVMQGGDWASNLFANVQTLDPQQNRKSLFLRAGYDILPDVELFGQFSISHSTVRSLCCQVFNVGNLVVSATNAFLPQSIADQAAQLGISQFTLGTMNGDLPALGTDNKRTVERYVIGANGSLHALGGTWHWNAYYQRGVARLLETSPDNLNKSRFALAIDAVRDPVSGNIVCRSTLTNPTNGCVPYNLFGVGVNGPDVINYLTGTSFRRNRITQDVVAASINGEPFSIWAGPVSIALGVEHRREAISGEVDPIGGANGYFVGNYLPTFGGYNVTEGFLETVVPLLRDLPFARELEFNGAVRLTDYSTSGRVTTWKLGGTWTPIDGVRFRATRSRDIRAPNLLELFNAGGLNQNTVIDPFNGNALTAYQGLVTGNPDLRPEVADTLGLGVVLQPRFIPGFSVSADYYNIKISGAIASVSAQTIVDRCFAGDSTYCAAITRGTVNGADVITQIRLQPFNFVSQIARGIDFQADYRMNLADISGGLSGNLTFSLLATHYLKSFTDNGIDAPTDQAGSNAAAFGVPNWIYRGSITYSNRNTTATITGRGVSAGVYDTSFIECTSGCPTSTIANRTINDNHIPGAFYLDAYLARRLHTPGGGEAELFFNVINVFNKDPAVVAPGPSGTPFVFEAANPNFYDVLGRVFRVGIRFNM